MASSSQFGSQVVDPEKPKKNKKHERLQPEPIDAASSVADLEKPKTKKKWGRSQIEPQDAVFPVDPRPEPMEMIRVKVEVVYDWSDRSLLILGYFPSGYDPTRAEPGIEFYQKVEERQKGSKRMELVVRPPGESNMEFVGTTYKGEAASDQLCTYTLGMLDKENGTLKIVPVSRNKVILL